jgi:PD-(D/E)XK nuclease superfamily
MNPKLPSRERQLEIAQSVETVLMDAQWHTYREIARRLGYTKSQDTRWLRDIVRVTDLHDNVVSARDPRKGIKLLDYATPEEYDHFFRIIKRSAETSFERLDRIGHNWQRVAERRGLMIPDLPVVLSYTNLNAYGNCPKRFWHQYLKKDIPDEVKTRQQFGGTKVHEALKKRLKIREPLPQEFGHHEGVCYHLENHNSIKHMELKLGVRRNGTPCDFFAADVALRGVLDLACSAAPNCLLVDWKSGKPWEDPFELRVQALLLAAHYPELTRFTGFYYWLRTGGVGKTHDLDPAMTWQMVCNTAKAIQGRLGKHDFPADENALCPWCPVPKGVGGPLDPVCQFRKDPPPK